MDGKQQELLMTNYEAVDSIVNTIAAKFSREYASSAGRKEMFDEFRSFAWLQAVVAMSRFNEDVGCSVTTYLGGHLWGRVARYVPTYLSMRQMEEIDPEVIPESSLVEDGEQWKDTCNANPWQCRPDQMLECKERNRLRKRLFRMYGNSVREACADSDAELMSNAERQRLFRRRRRVVSDMRACVRRDRGLFSKNRSDISVTLTHSQVFRAVVRREAAEEQGSQDSSVLEAVGEMPPSPVSQLADTVTKESEDTALEGA